MPQISLTQLRDIFSSVISQSESGHKDGRFSDAAAELGNVWADLALKQQAGIDFSELPTKVQKLIQPYLKV
jgi:muramidase (phage lysozyme)